MKTHTLKSLLVFCSILALVLLLQPAVLAQPSVAPVAGCCTLDLEHLPGRESVGRWLRRGR